MVNFLRGPGHEGQNKPISEVGLERFNFIIPSISTLRYWTPRGDASEGLDPNAVQLFLDMLNREHDSCIVGLALDEIDVKSGLFIQGDKIHGFEQPIDVDELQHKKADDLVTKVLELFFVTLNGFCIPAGYFWSVNLNAQQLQKIRKTAEDSLTKMKLSFVVWYVE